MTSPNTTPITKTKNWIARHKVLFGFIVVVVLFTGWRIAHGIKIKNQPTSYVLGTVSRGTIVASVSGTGQVSASNQVDLSPKASGNLIYLNAKVGQFVTQGALIAQVDAKDASYDLQTAKLSYDKLTTVDPDDLQNAKNSLDAASASARASLSQTYAGMGDNLNDLKSVLDGYIATESSHGLDSRAVPLVDTADTAYFKADDLLKSFSKTYLTITDASSNDQIIAAMTTEQNAAGAVAEAAKDLKDAVAYLRDNSASGMEVSEAVTAYTSVSTVSTSANSDLSQLLSSKTSLTNAEQALSDLQDGPDELDLRSSQASVQAKQEAYDDTKVVAPFSGEIASVPVNVGDNVSSSTTVATLITKQKVAELSLNEIDAAKVAAGDKATLTFDAIDGLTLTGEVLSVDLVGTVTQGVVNYDVKIGFDTDDDRVKPGMTVSADMITNTAPDVLVVPSSAVTTRGGASTVLVVSDTDAGVADNAASSTAGVVLATPPQAVTVTTGLADDTNTEITGGLTEGQHIVVRTVAKTSTASVTASAPNLFSGSAARAGTTSTTRTTGGNATFRASGGFGG